MDNTKNDTIPNAITINMILPCLAVFLFKVQPLFFIPKIILNHIKLTMFYPNNKSISFFFKEISGSNFFCGKE
ncbi:MAG TPA: hypothetical protein DHW82_10950 [Spirochaetia bacterium]|nr:hypothetical protein [Spirochaetia bacterium]